MDPPDGTAGSGAAGPPIGFAGSTDPTLQLAHRAYLAEQTAISDRLVKKHEILGLFDVPGMDNAVSICFWGRSGSYLLQSYLDSHPDVVILPMNGSRLIYQFFSKFAHLSLWEKLVAYPAYSQMNRGPDDGFLQGEFAVAAADYYAGVHGLHRAYGEMPPGWLASRLRFFQFLHAAYAVATERRPGGPRPLMIYAQHAANDEVARCFIEDFPRGQFIHTIRDPISCLDSWFDRRVELHAWSLSSRPNLGSPYFDAAVASVRELLDGDRAHRGMEARTRAIRFEDLHLAPEATMRRLAQWIGISYHPTLLESTFNGAPYVNRSGGLSWVGPSPSNAQRRSKNLNRVDRLLMFTLLHENFQVWNYDNPFGHLHRRSRLFLIVLLWLVPMKMEILNARLVMKRQALPALRRGRLTYACGALLFLTKRRLRMMLFLARQARLRLTQSRQPFRLL